MNVGFRLIDMENWPRREHFEAYFKNTPCTWSMTVQLDVTKLVRSGAKIYPALLYACGKVANRHEEFRMSLDEAGRPGVWDELHTSYTVFHKETETFSCLWTPYKEDPAEYYAAYQRDIERWGRVEGFEPQPDVPKTFTMPQCCPGKALRASISICRRAGSSCCLPSPLEGIRSMRDVLRFRLQYKYITPPATAFTHAVLLPN